MYNRKAIIGLTMATLLAATLMGCSSSPKVTRMAVEEEADLSGKWNDVDSRMVSEKMIGDCLNSQWIARFEQQHPGHLPVVIVQSVRNRSLEHINTQTFTKDLETAMVNSGLVDVVASKSEREELREERKDQVTGYTSDETTKSFGEEIGADFGLQGWINTIKDEVKGEYIIYYQVNLELIDIETNRKAWIGEQKIKKNIKRSKLKW
jgi:uncharacterized protein (TIGR02722 family)